MIAVDTNVLVYAYNERADQHVAARTLLGRLSQGSRPWALPWPCVLQFLGTVTMRSFTRPASPASAFAFVELLLGSPSLRRLLPTSDTMRVLRDVLEDSSVRGEDVHDAHIFALCLEHGVRELYTADKGFRRFRGLKVTDPFRR